MNTIAYLARAAALMLASPASAERAPDPPISLTGLGPLRSVSGTTVLRLGMPLSQAVKEFALNLDEPLNEEDPSCRTTAYDYPPLKVYILALDGKVASLSFQAEFGNIPETSYVTPEGIRLGSTLEDVLRAFPKGKQSVHSVTDKHQFLVWDKPEKSGWMFEFSSDKRVTGISVGDRSIEFYEGCA